MNKIQLIIKDDIIEIYGHYHKPEPASRHSTGCEEEFEVWNAFYKNHELPQFVIDIIEEEYINEIMGIIRKIKDKDDY